MFSNHSAYLTHQLKRCMRPDAHLFLRPDWRRHVRPGFEDDLPFALYEQKYRPDQPRAPAGVQEGGQWTEAGGGGSGGNGDVRAPEDTTSARQTIELSAASRKRGYGHHYVAGAEVRKREISEEAANVFKNAKTGPLLDVRSNKWDKAHVAYNRAIGEALDDYLKTTGIDPKKMTAAQAREFLGKVFESPDPRIRSYNIGIQMREIMQRLLRRGAAGGRGLQ